MKKMRRPTSKRRPMKTKPTTVSTPKPRRRRSKRLVEARAASNRLRYLNRFLKMHGGIEDPMLPILESLSGGLTQTVLYPGSGIHVTPSLCFQDVTYVDSKPTLAPYFKDPAVRDWLQAHVCKYFMPSISLAYKCLPFGKDLDDIEDVKPGTFDLLISNSRSRCWALVSTALAKYLKKNGLLLASDEHGDARTAFVNPEFKLLAVYDDNIDDFDYSEEGLYGHFQTKTGAMISEEQVEESIREPDRNNRSFKLCKESMYYLFKKVK